MKTSGKQPATILFATDGSDSAALAGQVAAALAVRSGGEIHVAHAWVPGYVYGAALPESGSIPGTPEERGEHILRDGVSAIAREGLQVSGMHLRRGHPSDVIDALATELEAGIVVVGRRGAGGISRVLIGSVSQTVAARARCPVMVVPPTAAPALPRCILTGDDGSDDAARALNFAADLARVCDVDLVACRALPVPEEMPSPEQAAELDDMVIGTTGDLRARSMVATGRQPRHEGLVRVVLGNPAEALEGLQRGDRESWLVVGRRGAAGAVAPIGSVSVHLARKAVGPVIIVPLAAPVATTSGRTVDPLIQGRMTAPA